jgi:hypothetical protein
MANFSLETLTEGIRQRHVGSQNKTLVEKWSRTGLLRGLNGVNRENMARLLENQASQVLKEVSSVGNGAGGSAAASGDLRGFTNIAFPIVRRVFGGLIANELVSIQPMSLPSGLLFYLDYTFGGTLAGSPNAVTTYGSGSSIYNSPSGKGVQSGSLAVGGQYDLAGAGYSRVYNNASVASALFITGAFGSGNTFVQTSNLHATGSDGVLLQFDPQLTTAIETNSGGAGATAGNAAYLALLVPASSLTGADLTAAKEFVVQNTATTAGFAGVGNDTNSRAIQGNADGAAATRPVNVKRLTQVGTLVGGSFVPNALAPAASAYVLFVCSGTANTASTSTLNVGFPVADSFSADATGGDTLVIPSFESNFGTTPSPSIPEIDIKVESIPVVASTRKLRARWSPELAQDLNAYHSLDAEVELTQILSEQIALELDREILNDLLTQANAANYYWSRAPGQFVNKTTGIEVSRNTSLTPGPAFTGTVREWYETLVETIIDVANEIHRKTLRGSANFIVVGPDVATILEASIFYKPNYSLDGDGQVSQPMVIGADKVGSLSNRFTVYKDPYFPRNKILVGYKGGSYLETGYVYAPYVPLIVTPTIFAPEDFTPRKGVMTRYGKKMVRSDFYGTVTCLNMNVI